MVKFDGAKVMGENLGGKKIPSRWSKPHGTLRGGAGGALKLLAKDVE